MKVVAAVVHMKVLSQHANLPKMFHYIRKASAAGADIVCFPEMAFNPRVRNPSKERDLANLRAQCKSSKIIAVVNGYFRAKGNTYNRTWLIGRNGELLGHYDKIHPWMPEIGKVRSGAAYVVIDTDIGKVGLCTCWDLFFPSLFKRLKEKGAEIVFCPSYWRDEFGKEGRFVQSVPVVIAYQHFLFFVYCNALLRGGTSVSKIVAPWGELAELHGREGMVTAALYPVRLKRFQRHFRAAMFERAELF